MTSPKLSRPIEEIRAELLNDPHTIHIAEKLHMSLEDYVEQVLYYVKNPDKQPEFHILPEGEEKIHGAATVSEVKQWFTDVHEGKIDLRPKHYKDAFDVIKKNPFMFPT